MRTTITDKHYVDPNKEFKSSWHCQNYTEVMETGGDPINEKLNSVGGKENIVLKT